MSIVNAFDIGVSGLIAQSNKINVISDNIANLNTVGYKGFTADFLALVQSAPNPVRNSYNGARPTSKQLNSLQGEISGSDRVTDLAINGNGMFVVTPEIDDDSPLRFTRAGAFSFDEDGNMRNSAGFFLRGWRLDVNGDLPAALQVTGYDSATAISNLDLVNFAATDTTSVPTSVANIKANLNSSHAAYNPEGDITFTANPTAGDTITINGVTWTFVASGATGSQTNIGADLDTTIRNLVNDLNASTNTTISEASYSNVGGNKLHVIYDALQGGAATFTMTSSSANGVVTPLLLYDATSATQNMSGGAIASHFNRSAQIIDNNGTTHDIRISFLKTNLNSWAVEMTAVPATDVTSAGGQIVNGTMTFNGDGTLNSVSASLTSPITFPWASSGTTPTGASSATIDNTVTFNWGTAGQIFGTVGATTIGLSDGMRQLASSFQVDYLTQNGHPAGSLQGVDVGRDGIVTGLYSNGTRQRLYAIPLAKFNNVDALSDISGTAFMESEKSGLINIFSAGDSGTGAVVSGSLERSNVDLPTQMTDMIIAQRAYQANTKTVMTSDEMLKTVTDMLR